MNHTDENRKEVGWCGTSEQIFHHVYRITEEKLLTWTSGKAHKETKTLRGLQMLVQGVPPHAEGNRGPTLRPEALIQPRPPHAWGVPLGVFITEYLYLIMVNTISFLNEKDG